MARAQLNLCVQPYRMLKRADAASYCGLSATNFLANCPVLAVLLPVGRKAWDVKDLDRWIEGLKEDSRPSDDDLLDQLGARYDDNPGQRLQDLQ
ncbi:hypothetical protein ACMG4P_03645 [Pseudovibrio denitrificans]|uniref:hypothetical protein n=1 Tax=Pseudovibrio denitrificans TaxID=258256 RepID=UPI0039BF1080